MAVALEQARAAAESGDVPVGAVVVVDRRIVGLGRNRREVDHDPLAHAEVVALRNAAATLGSWRLDEATLYVTLEPCPMCAGATVQARVRRVVYGAADPKGGGVRSLYQICDDPRGYHRVVVEAGVLAEPCAEVMRSFFAERR